MSENLQEEIYAIDKLFCTLCQHDLNHPLYLIRSHPILSVPLCIICHEDVLKSELFDENADVSDFCTWCGDGGDLLLCSDEEHCNRAFCHDCLTSNLGNEAVKEIESTDDWKCLCCDTSVLTPFTAALELGTANSVYNQSLSESNSNTNETKKDDGDNSDSDDNPEAARGMYILQSIVKECDNMTNTLSETALNDKIAQVRDELRQSADPNNRIHVAAEEEMQAWQAHWTRHYDILQTQEAALHDHLSSLGFDPQQLQSYSLSDEALAGQLTAREKVAKAAADLELNSAPAESRKKKSTTEGGTSQADGLQSSTTVPLWATPKRPALKSKRVKIHWEEAVVEVDTEQRLPALTAQALQDPLVLQYQDRGLYADIDPSRYPASFCNVTPITVIKAYFYASASERRGLARSYCILPHICIILSSLSAHHSFPDSTDQWSFADTVHPAVRLALFYAESATTSLILCQHYQLSDDYCQVTDFGSTAEVLSTYNSTRKAHNKQRAKSGFGEKHEERFTLQQLRDAEDCEERTDNYLLQEYFSNEKTQTKDNTHICTICTQKPCVCISKSEHIRKRLQPVVKNDAEDEEKGLKERLKSVKVVMGKRKRSAEEERRQSARRTERHGRAQSTSTATTATISTVGLLDVQQEGIETVAVKCEPSSDKPTELVVDSSSSVRESECPQTTTQVEATAGREGVGAATDRMSTVQEEPVLDPVVVDFGEDSVRELEEERCKDKSAGDGSAGTSEPMELSEETVVPAAAVETVTVAAQSANPVVAATPVQTGKSSTVRSPPTSTAAPSTVVSHSPVSSASAVETTTTTAAAAAAGKPSNPAPTPGSTALPPTAPASTARSVNTEVVDLTLDSDDDEGGAATSEVEIPSSTATRGSPPQTADVSKHTEQTDSESELAEELRATAPLPLPGGAPLFVPKAPPARPAQPIAGLQTTKRDDAHGLPKTPIQVPPKSTGGKIDSFFQARRSHTVSLPADARITTVDSDDEDLEEEFEEGDEGPGSGQKPQFSEGKKKRGRPSSKQRATVALWSKETLQVNAAERQRRKELNCHKYFNEDSGFALNQERPEGDGAVMLIEDFTEKLKDHQKEGVRFLWKNVLGSVKMATRSADSGSGCIVAHCMGLGKTLTVIAFTATLLTNPLVQAIEDPWRPAESKQSSAATKAINTGNSSSSSSSESTSTAQPNASAASTTTTNNSTATAVPTTVASPPPPAIPRKRLIHTVLIVAPKNTLDNWIIEYKRWTPSELHGALNITSIMSNPSEKGSATWTGRLQRLRDWHSTGGVMVMGYEMFRILTNLENTKAVKEDARANATTVTASAGAATDDVLGVEPLSSSSTGNTGITGSTGVSLAHIREARRYLQDPGPDLVVADEAHVIKEKSSVINQMVSQIRTKRRIALTGSPLQNNLMEYWCMINWVKYRFLGDFKEFRRYYVEPIKAGSDKKAVSNQVRKMKQRTHILNKKLTPIVDRKDMRTLEKDLQPKREFTISIRMSTFQQYLYKYFLTLLDQFPNKTQRLLVGYNCLLRIWNHPACAVMHDFKETNTQLRAAAKSSNTNLAAAAAGTSATTSTIGGMDRWATTTVAAVGGEHGSSSSSALAPGAPRPALKASTARPIKCTLQYVRQQLTSIVRHFQRDDTRLLAEVQQSASQVEDSLLKKPSVQGASSGAASGVGGERDPVLVDSDTDDSRLASSSKRKSRKRSRRRMMSEGGGGDDEISVDSEDSDDSSSSLDGFVVRDDVIEFEDASETELGAGQPRKRRHGSSRGKKQRLHKGGKRIRSDDETASEGEGSDHSGSRGTAAETSRPSTALSLDPELAEQTAEEGSDSEGGESIENPSVIHATGTTEPSASTSANQGETTDLSEERKGASPTADSRAVSPRSTDTAAVADRTDSPQRVDTLLSELAAAQSQDDLAEEHADAMARSLAISSDWWKKIAATTDDKDSLDPAHQHIIDSLQLLKLSNKMVTLLSLLALSVLQGDKMLVFSQSLYSLDAIEMFLGMSHWDRLIEAVQEGRYERRKFSQWQLNKEYLRIDGATGQRQKCIDKFNKKGSPYHLMLISTKAGNMGINLQAANRVVIFDTSWNPVHDLQAMYRAYRYGQTKPVFVYRLLSAGSMEERIYKMQVIKQSLAARVVDAQMPDNHFSAEETLLSFDVQDDATEKMDRAAQVLEGAVKDEVLGTFVRHFASDLLTSIEDHSGLLEDNKDEHLNAEEQEQAEADLLVEMGRVSAEHLAQQAALAALQASLASGAQGQTVLNVPVNMMQQQSGGGVSSSSSSSNSSGVPAQAIPWSERMFNVHNAGGGTAAHTGLGLPTLPSIGQRTPAGVPAGSAAEQVYIQQQVQLQQRQQLQAQQRMLYQQQQEQMYTERLQAAMEANRTHQASSSSSRDSTLLPSLVKKASQGQQRREDPAYTAQVNEIMARVAAKTSPRSSSQTLVQAAAPAVPVPRAAAGLPSKSAAATLPIPTHHSLPSASTAIAPVHPAQQAGASTSTNRSASAVATAPPPPPPSAAAESAQRSKEDILLLFSQTVMPDPSYISSVRLLSSQIRNTTTTYTANALEQRHAELVRSGRAAELFQLPALRTYIEQYRKNNQHASGSSGLQ